MINYSAYWQAQQKKQAVTVPKPQTPIKSPKNDD
jgi:hypothetical protein